MKTRRHLFMCIINLTFLDGTPQIKTLKLSQSKHKHGQHIFNNSVFITPTLVRNTCVTLELHNTDLTVTYNLFNWSYYMPRHKSHIKKLHFDNVRVSTNFSLTVIKFASPIYRLLKNSPFLRAENTPEGDANMYVHVS